MAIARYVPFFLLFRGKKTKFVSENPQILSPRKKKNHHETLSFSFRPCSGGAVDAIRIGYQISPDPPDAL